MAENRKANPKRGEVWIVDLDYTGKVRPIAVISPSEKTADELSYLVINAPYDETARDLVTIVAHTRSTRNSPFEVTVHASFLKSGAFDCQQIFCIPRVKFERRIGVLTKDQMDKLDAKLRDWLSLQCPPA